MNIEKTKYDKKITTSMIEFQWIEEGNYDPISTQFNEWMHDCKWDDDPYFEILHMNTVTSKKNNKVLTSTGPIMQINKTVETLYIIYKSFDYSFEPETDDRILTTIKV